MSNENINDETKNKRKKFTAIFDRYEFTNEPKRIHLKNVMNENREIIKENYFLKYVVLQDQLIGNMLVGEEAIEFEGEIVESEDGIKIINPTNIKRKR